MAMTVENLETVRALCIEVDKLISAVRAGMIRDGCELHGKHPETFPKGYVPHTPYGSPTTGELRRRSMDLTRALARLRS